MKNIRTILLLVFASVMLTLLPASASTNAPTTAPRYRVIVSSDIGGSDPDDHQSMVHLMLYTDTLDFEGLISTHPGGGKKEEILKVIGLYEHDYPNLKTYSDKYPTPDALRAITKAGAASHIGVSGFGQPTEGSDWIIKCARRDDPRPLYVLVWGGVYDVAQALHDAPDILPKLRVYFIGGPNKQGSVNAYNYVEQNFPNLWIIENNDTYRGWFCYKQNRTAFPFARIQQSFRRTYWPLARAYCFPAGGTRGATSLLRPERAALSWEQ
jgi:hypothetical protein